MTRSLLVQPLSIIDVADIFDYLASKSKRAAVRFFDAYDEAISLIESQPEQGNRLILPGYGDTGLRYQRPAGFASYLILYRFDDTKIQVLRRGVASAASAGAALASTSGIPRVTRNGFRPARALARTSSSWMCLSRRSERI